MLRSEFPVTITYQLEVLPRDQVYQYEIMGSWQLLNETPLPIDVLLT